MERFRARDASCIRCSGRGDALGEEFLCGSGECGT